MGLGGGDRLFLLSLFVCRGGFRGVGVGAGGNTSLFFLFFIFVVVVVFHTLPITLRKISFHFWSLEAVMQGVYHGWRQSLYIYAAHNNPLTLPNTPVPAGVQVL